MPSYMMSGALPVTQDYKYTPYIPKDCVYDKPKPVRLFERQKTSYKSLIAFKKNNMDLLQSNDDLALQYALVASCYTYVHERNFSLAESDKKDLIDRFIKHRNKFNGFFKITKFRV